MQLYTMGPEPDRRSFLESLFSFNEDKGSPITAMPQVSKQPLDLYKLYMQVREKGGMVEVRHCSVDYIYMFAELLLLVAGSRLNKRLCPSVGQSVSLS